MTNTENHHSLFADVPGDSRAAYYVVWVRPPRSVVPWRVLSSGGQAKVLRAACDADEMALRLSDGSDLCAVVAAVYLPAGVSDEVSAVLASGEVRNVLD